MGLFERFVEIFRWNLESYSPQYLRIKNGDQFYNLNPTLAKQPSGIRLLVTNIWTTSLLSYQEAQGCFQIERAATPEEDKEHGIDVLLNLGFSQYKIRQWGYPDFGAVRFQPCYGLDHPETKDGRDYRCLRDYRTQHHFSALYDDNFDVVYRVDSSEFWDKVQQLDADWNRTPLNAENRHWKRADGAEVLWQKKEANYHKYNFYLPPKGFDSLVEFKVSERHGHLLQSFYKKVWGYVKDTYIQG